MNIYKETVYYYSQKYSHGLSGGKIFWLIWLRTCYAPQIYTWLYYIQQLNEESKYQHSFKIIQAERYFNDDTFHQTLNSILCYIHYDINDENYNEWMTQCTQNDNYNAKSMDEQKANSKTKKFEPKLSQIELISASFKSCNKWLEDIIDWKSEQYLILDQFNLDLWYL